MVTRLRRLARGPGRTATAAAPARGAPRRPATSAASRSTPTTATCSTSSTAASSAPARAAWRCAAATPSCARPAPAPCGWTTSSSPTRLGLVRGPDRARVLHRLERHRRDRRALPEPGRRDRVGARDRRLARAAVRQPGADGPRARRRGADRQPDRPTRPSTRSRRSTSATGWSGMIKMEWDGISGGPGVERAISTFFDELRERAADGGDGHSPRHRRLGRARAVHRRPGPGVRGARRRARSSGRRRRRSAFTVRAGDESGRRLFTIALTAVITIEPRSAATTPTTRERLLELFGEPRAMGVDDDELPLGAGRRAGAGVRGLDRVRARRPVHLRPRARRGEVLPRARGRRGAAALPLQRHGLLRGRRAGGCRSCRSRGTARRVSGCRSRSGARRSTPSTPTAPGCRSTPHTLERLQRRKAERGLPTFDAVLGELLAEEEG